MKKAFIVSILLITLLFSGFVFVQAKPAQPKQGSEEYTIPEQDGTYNVPGRPDIKVRVFVHNPKVKPGPTVSPSLICSADPDSGAVVDPTGWKLPSTWTYNLNSNSVPNSVGSSTLSNIAQLAFGVWSGASKGKVIFIAGLPTTATQAKLDGKNIITWGKAPGSALAVTYIWYKLSGAVVEVDTIMN